VHSAFDFVYRGKRTERLQRIRKAASTEPDNEEIAGVLLNLSLIAGAPDAADQLSRPFRLAPDNAGPVLVESNRLKYAHILQRRGDTANANRLVEEAEQNALKLMQEGDESYVLRLETAASWSLRNNPQKALEWLDVAYTAGAHDYRVLESDLFFDKLHNEVRFRELVHRMTIDVAQMRKHAQEQLPDIFSRSGLSRAADSGSPIRFPTETTATRTLVTRQTGSRRDRFLPHRNFPEGVAAWKTTK
jgi:hypothetical protein